MNADPDALRRAADEMDALITRQAAHLADIERLTAERAHIHESARERARKLNEVRAELGRAGYPVDECDWPTDALRQFVNAHLALKALPWSDAPITMALCSLLGDCRPAEIVGRVRDMKFDLGLAKGKHDNYYHHLARLREVLDAANAGHPDGTLVERVRAIAAERDTALSRAYRLESILAEHNGDKAPDDYAAFLRDLLTTLTGERDDLARRLEAAELDRAGQIETANALRRERDGATRKLGLAGLYRAGLVEANNDLRRERDGALTQMDHLDKRLGLVASQLERAEAERDDIRATLAKCHTACTSVGIAIRTDVSERVHHMAAELASLREKAETAKPTTPKWAGPYLLTDDGHRYWVSNVASGCWVSHSASGGKTAGCGADETSARRLAELLAGHDPGGIWRVAGSPVTVDVVRAVCPTVAVSWGPA